MDERTLLAERGFAGIERLGMGGMGTVYVAFDSELQRRVAVKVLNPGRELSQSVLITEARAAAQVPPHPNIVSIHSIGMLNTGAVYIVMEYAEGGSLRDRQGRIDERDVFRVGVRLSGALSVIHAAGVLHRDIKPENVLFDAYDEPKLADFGVAQFAETDGESVFGFTERYAAPEVLSIGRATGASDVYSLALTLIDVAVPANSWSAADRSISRRSRPQSDPRAYPVRERAVAALSQWQVPATVKAQFEIALSEDPASRPSAYEFGRMLQDIEQSLGFSPTPMTTKAPPPSGRSVLRRDEAEILAQSTSAGFDTVLRAAIRVEDRRVRRRADQTALGVGVVALVSSIASVVAGLGTKGLDRLPLIALALSALAALVVPLVLWIVVHVRRRRRNSLSNRALELSARLRNAYLKELEAVRPAVVSRAFARQVDTQ